jgi:hypothetical protein
MAQEATTTKGIGLSMLATNPRQDWSNPSKQANYDLDDSHPISRLEQKSMSTSIKFS